MTKNWNLKGQPPQRWRALRTNNGAPSPCIVTSIPWPTPDLISITRNPNLTLSPQQLHSIPGIGKSENWRRKSQMTTSFSKSRKSSTKDSTRNKKIRPWGQQNCNLLRWRTSHWWLTLKDLKSRETTTTCCPRSTWTLIAWIWVTPWGCIKKGWTEPNLPISLTRKQRPKRKKQKERRLKVVKETTSA